RIRSQRITPRTASALPTAREISLELIGTRAEVRRRGGIIPAWVVFGMIILATFGLCVTATMRTYGQRQAASAQFSKLQRNVETLRRDNAALQTDLRRLQTDPKAIESAARSQLNMARGNEIIVPVE
ncbi:MAG TPA: septum formation initiator family protein, partial [Pyrinomonadaceae bacterium]|nr:septum formation initiator family protein [Pyrinomonadaceae bacterium]